MLKLLADRQVDDLHREVSWPANLISESRPALGYRSISLVFICDVVIVKSGGSSKFDLRTVSESWGRTFVDHLS